MNQQKLENLANNHSVDDNVWSKESFIQGYKKSQETHQFTKKDMIEFAEWRRDFEFTDDFNNYEKEELLQLWIEQKNNQKS